MRILIIILFVIFLLGSCASVKDGCYYPEPPPQFDKEGEIISKWVIRNIKKLSYERIYTPNTSRGSSAY